MGTLRTGLALLVVLAHISLWDPIPVGLYGGMFAVRAFFLLSGFYMALVLDVKYKNQILSFYANRAVRLYPLYWLAICITILIWVFTDLLPSAAPVWEKLFREKSFVWLTPYLVFSNLSFLGLDFANLISIQLPPGNLFYYQNAPSLPLLNSFTVIPQAWTLGTEVTFYLLAPFIARLSFRWLAALTAAALGMFYIPLAFGLPILPDVRALFSANLFIFLFGMFSYVFYKHFRSWLQKINKAYLGLSIPLAAFTVLAYSYYFPSVWSLANGPYIAWAIIEPIILLILIFLIPAMFMASKTWKWDYKIGELSYPLYITHLISIGLIHKFLSLGFMAWANTPIEKVLIYLGGSCVIAAFFVIVLIDPIDRLRGHKLAQESN